MQAGLAPGLNLRSLSQPGCCLYSFSCFLAARVSHPALSHLLLHDFITPSLLKIRAPASNSFLLVALGLYQNDAQVANAVLRLKWRSGCGRRKSQQYQNTLDW